MRARYVGLVVGLLLAAMVAPVWGADDTVYLMAPGTRQWSAPRTFWARLGVKFSPPKGAKVVRIWLVQPRTEEGQFVTDLRYSKPPVWEGVDPLYGNRFAYFEYRNPEKAVAPTMEFKVTKHQLNLDVHPLHIPPVAQWPEGFETFLRSEQRVVVNDDIRRLAQEIARDATTAYDKVKAFYLWILDNVRYTHEDLPDGTLGCTLQADSVHVLHKVCGHCSDWHGFFIALCRAAGIPARLNYGLELTDRKRYSPSHCRAEAYLPGYGWVNMDITHARYHAHEAGQMTEFGYVENTWIRMMVGTDYPLSPPSAAPWPASRTGTNPPLVRIQYIEVDGEPWPDLDTANPKFKGQELNPQYIWDFKELSHGQERIP